MKDFISKNNVKFRQLTNLIGNIILICVGLLFVLFVDLKISWVQNSNVTISLWMFFAIVTVIGGPVVYFVGDSMKNKKNKTITLKGVGLFLSVLYFPVIFLFNSVALASSSNASVFAPILVLSVIFTVIGLLVLALNYTLSILFVNEDY